ncbi:MAG: nucleoside deaminase [Candidatus Sericytochromatia bacterium]|nr:nucleoside deaminase [Candidatus Sericytochromatia bacterium]
MEANEYYMELAIQQAETAYSIGEVPVGGLIIYNNQIIATAYNKKEINNNSLDHAEIILIGEASKKIDRWRLTDCIMYITLEPCPMCAGAIIQSRISKLVFGANNKKYGSFGSVINLENYYPDAKNLTIEKGVLQDKISIMMKKFFRNKLKT